MKESIVFVIGGVIVLGIAVYAIHKGLQSQKEKSNEKGPALTKKEQPADTVHDYTREKEDASASIKVRHAEAARAIGESLQTIFNEDKAEEVVTENSEPLDKMDDDLDNLLK